MKNRFPGYFALSKKDYDDLWEGSIISLDANVLLNLYRYSVQTREELVSLLKSIKERLWISHQAAYEYLENRLEEINRQEKAYDDMIAELNEIIQKLGDRRKHPFISQALLKRLTKTHDVVKKELNSNKKEHTDRYNYDFIQDELIALLDGRVGPAYLKEEKKEICKLGDERYKEKIPPGYKDEAKSSPTGSNIRMYGDLFIWKQLTAKALKDKVDIIFVTDDRKGDWWRIVNGKTIGPRPELVQEFMEITGRRFHMYKIDNFMEYGAKKFKSTVTEETIKEIRGISDESARNKMVETSDAKQPRRTFVVADINVPHGYSGYTLSNASPLVIASGKPVHWANASGEQIQWANASGEPIRWFNPIENVWSVAVPSPQYASEQTEEDIDSQIKKKLQELEHLKREKSRNEAEPKKSESRDETEESK